jgi:hypothetical protein
MTVPDTGPLKGTVIGLWMCCCKYSQDVTRVDSNDRKANEDDGDQVRVPQGEDQEKFVRKTEKGELFALACCNIGGRFMILTQDLLGEEGYR